MDLNPSQPAGFFGPDLNPDTPIYRIYPQRFVEGLLSGKFVIPGLFDSHVHWEEWMGELYVNHGVTSIVALSDVPKGLRARSEL